MLIDPTRRSVEPRRESPLGPQVQHRRLPVPHGDARQVPRAAPGLVLHDVPPVAHDGPSHTGPDEAPGLVSADAGRERRPRDLWLGRGPGPAAGAPTGPA